MSDYEWTPPATTRIGPDGVGNGEAKEGEARIVTLDQLAATVESLMRRNVESTQYLDHLMGLILSMPNPPVRTPNGWVTAIAHGVATPGAAQREAEDDGD